MIYRRAAKILLDASHGIGSGMALSISSAGFLISCQSSIALRQGRSEFSNRFTFGVCGPPLLCLTVITLRPQ